MGQPFLIKKIAFGPDDRYLGSDDRYLGPDDRYLGPDDRYLAPMIEILK
jgi:hypothetical protein